MQHEARHKRKNQVVNLWKEKYPRITINEVKALTGLSERTIYRYLKEAGLSLPPRAGRPKNWEKIKRAHQLYKIHQNKSEVARIMKMSRKQITRYLKETPE